MSTFTFSGISEVEFQISDGTGTSISKQISRSPMFIPMNAWDCCKDAFLATTKVIRPGILLSINNTLFGPGEWLDNWRSNLKMNFKEYMTATMNTEEEVVFERNKIKVERLNQIFYFNESGMGGARVAFDQHIEIDTGAQKIDEGPGAGDPYFSFPKQGSTLVFDESFFKAFFGFPNYIKSWQCVTAGPSSDPPYTYQVITERGSVSSPDKLSVSNPAKNRLINASTEQTEANTNAVLFKELGDSMQTASYLAFIKIMENIVPGNQSSYPINMPDELFKYIIGKSEGNFTKLIYYLTIMLTSDNTVHYRNIKLGLPSCLTGSHEEKPYENSTKTGRIFLPLTDLSEKLKSLLEMENTLVAKNNREIFQRLQTANLNRNLTYFKLSRGTPRETAITKPLNTSDIFDFITNLTRLSQVYYDSILAEINGYGSTIVQSTYESIRYRIIGTTEGSGFKPFLCPPFVIPLPPIPNVNDPTGSPINRKGCIISLPIINLETIYEDGTNVKLGDIVIATLTTAGLDPSIMRGGDHHDIRPPDQTYTKQLIPVSNPIVDRFSGSEKFIIYLLSKLIKPEAGTSKEYYQEIFIYYTNCIYGLQYYKNIPDQGFGPSDEEYAYLRLNRAILFLKKNIIPDLDESILHSFIQEGLNHLNDNGLDPSNPNDNPLFLEEGIDKHIDTTLLEYFEYVFKYISGYDDATLNLDQSYLSIACADRNSIITNQRIGGLGIELQQGCIAVSDIINWLKKNYEGQDILSLPNDKFINPYTKLQFSTDIIDFIRSQASPQRISRSTPPFGGKKKRITKNNKKNNKRRTKYNKKIKKHTKSKHLKNNKQKTKKNAYKSKI